MITVIGNYR